MSTYLLRLYEDRIPASHAPVHLPCAPRAVYLREGGLTIEDDWSSQFLPGDTAQVSEDELTLLAGPDGATVWRWELADADGPGQGELRSAPACESTLKLEAEIELDDGFSWMMRCDRVEFPPGGVALTHVHQGPGIRIVLEGEITIETEGTVASHKAGEAWLERGHYPVLAPTTEAEPTTFIRCFFVPRGSKGRSSIRYVRAEDAAAPKVQRYKVYAERQVDLACL
ncbi:cupin domain-containing protein [Alkalilimnicola sp. S0819]|uniref:cupin domain-containing protein n=1 Tax=Alkalilimnicola sp. S0819 TaxID=2613922 RepID=UPI0012620590|nr:cupin domain-containing protein [Alkalilimnicola sp. S0819]KAB7623681.1 cupin domain-containing protein [Alkalilimnicola sp. S0819]MPQ16808.1 hypothetical protein [Alkalilimnicola sp. S0819]